MSDDKPYEMPKVYLGQMIVWYAAPGGEGAPGIVTAVGSRNLSLAVFAPGFSNAITPDGALHVSDPMVSKMLENDGGVWDYTDPMKEKLQRDTSAATSKGKATS